MTNSPNPLNWIDAELDALRRGGLLRRRRTVTSLADGWCLIDGRKLRNFAGNDYLNLAHHPRVVAAATTALAEGGAGASASALVTGHTKWHATLEEKLAQFEGQPSAILFPTGYAANVGTIGALAGSDDLICSDRLNHASLIDGCRLSGARVRIYRHDDLATLESELESAAGFRRRLIVSDSVFSMDGDLAPLPALCDLAERFDAMLIVDEAHATGLFGPRGRGVAELFGVEERVAVRIGTLSKAIGSLGGFVAGPTGLIDWLWNRARPQMFSTALPPSACAAALAAVELIESEPWRREHVLKLSAEFRIRLAAAGIATPLATDGPIVPILLDSPERATQAAARLEERGFLVAAIRPPTVPEGTSRLRITLNCGHSPDDLAGLIDALARLPP